MFDVGPENGGLRFYKPAAGVGCLLLVLSLATNSQAATTCTFNGTNNSNWSEAANWQSSAKPSASDHVIIAADCQADEALPSLGTLTINATKTLNLLSQSLTASGTIDINGTLTAGSGTITVSGDANFDYSDGTFNCGTSLLDMQGTGQVRAQDLPSRSDLYDLKCAYPGKTTSIGSNNTGVQVVKSVLTIQGGTLAEITNGFYQGLSLTANLSSPLVVNGTPDIRTNLTFLPSSTANTITLPALTTKGSLYLDGSGAGSGTVSMVLGGDLVIDKQFGRNTNGLSLFGVSSGSKLSFSTANRALTITCQNAADPAFASNATWNNTSLDMGSSVVTIPKGSVAFMARSSACGPLNFATSTWTVNNGSVSFAQQDAAGFSANLGASRWYVKGNWTHSAAALAVDYGTSIVTLNGSASQTFDTLGRAIYELDINTAAGATLTTGMTLAKLKILPGSLARFTAGQTFTVTGTIDWQGAPGNLVTLRSTQDDADEDVADQWGLDPRGARIVSYVDVKDSNNINGQAIHALYATDSSAGGADGVNTNWAFDSYAENKWIAAGAGSWNTAGNWSQGRVPQAGDKVVFTSVADGGSVQNCTGTGAGTVAQGLAGLEVRSGYSGTLTFDPGFAGGSLQTLHINGDVTVNAGTWIMSGQIEAKTFPFGNVDTAAETITIAAHGYASGDLVQITTTTTMPGGLTSGTGYYVGNVTANTFTLHTTLAAALAGTSAINLTSQGAGTHTSTRGVGVSLHCWNFSLANGATVHSDYQGFAAGAGPMPGNGTSNAASHGGRGGNRADWGYGSTLEPTTLGSGGGGTAKGGGAIKINAGTGTLSVDGTLRCNGQGTADNNGGGAGGSIYLLCATFSGASTGLLRADGGNSNLISGGGGRIAVVWGTSTYSGAYSCAGGANASQELGRAGTLSLTESSALDLTVAYDVGLASGSHTFRNITVNANKKLVLHSSYTGTGAGAVGTGCSITASSFTVQSGATVEASLEGFRGGGPGDGPAAGNGTSYAAAHGGRGGGNATAAYGAVAGPITLGSGGGGSSILGGGAIKIDVGSGILTVDGAIKANGNNTVNNWGGGAGGSIWLLCGTFAGASSGLLQANGGNGNLYGGGGGRIALQYATSTFSGTTSVAGGTGPTAAGEAGSALPGVLTLSNHAAGQLSDSFAGPGTYSNQSLCRFRFTTGGNTDDAAFENIHVTRLVFDLTGVAGILSGDLSNVEVWLDSDGNGTPDSQIPTASTQADIAGASGTITVNFSGTNFAVDTRNGKNYLLRASLANVAVGDGFTIQLTAADSKITSSGQYLSKSVTTAYPSAGFNVYSGSAASVTHLVPSIGTVVWTNAAGGNAWSTVGNWDLGRTPLAGDQVLFSSSYNLPCTAAPGDVAQNLGSLTLGSGYTSTVTFGADFAAGPSQTLTLAGDLSVQDGALVFTGKNRGADDLSGQGATLNCANFTMGANGVVHSDGLGCLPTHGPGSGASGQGASHGGRGEGNSDPAYGSATAPATLGSGGSNGAGGGALTINAASGTVTVNGALRANGGDTSAFFLPGWTRRKSHALSPSTGAGTNYQVKVIAHYGSGTDGSPAGTDVYLNSLCRTDFGDVRFTAADGTTELSYWIESKTDSNNAVFWIKVAADLGSSQTIYLYYGNSGATTTSNGSNTFLFFDDFSGDLGKWTKHKNAANISIQSGYVELAGGGTSSPYGHAVLGSAATYSGFTDGIIEGRVLLTSTSIAEISTRGNFSTNAGYKARLDARAGEGLSHMKPPYTDGSWSMIGTKTGTAVPNGSWQSFQVTVLGTSLTVAAAGQTKTVTDSTYAAAGEISLQNHYGANSRYDDIRVRKYVSPEPAHGAWGSEEGNSVADAGAGGSLLVLCNTLAGNGTLSARGGNGTASGGGGGRIALSYATSTFSGTTLVRGGNGATSGEAGSLVPANLRVADFESGQANGFTIGTGAKTDVPLYRFDLATDGNYDDGAFEPPQITQLVFDLSGVSGIASGEVSNLRIAKDLNRNGVYESGTDTLVPGSGSIVSIAGATGTLTLNFGAGQYLLGDSEVRSKAFATTDVNTGTDSIAIAGGHGLTTGQVLYFTTTGTLPTPLSSTHEYFARSTGTTTFTLHATRAGALADTGRVDLSNPGTGTHTLKSCAADYLLLADVANVGSTDTLSVQLNLADAKVGASGTVLSRNCSTTQAGLGFAELAGSTTQAVHFATEAPLFSAQPADQSVNRGDTATFSVTAAGSAPLTYQWQKNGVNIGGATSSSYTTPGTVVGDNGNTYRVVVSNAYGTATSTAATLHINPVLTASSGPNGSISPTGAMTVSYNSSQVFTITPSTGYHVADVLVDGISVGAMGTYTFSNTVVDHTITASFAINTYTITASAGAHGKISPAGSVVVDHGSTQTFVFAADPGYALTDTVVDGVSLGAVTGYTFSNVTADHVIAVGPGLLLGSPLAVTPSATPGVVSAGQEVRLDCVPSGGTGNYVAFGWTGPAGYVSALQSPQPLRLSAPGSYTYTVQVTDLDGSVASGSVTVVVGEAANSVVLKAGGLHYRVTGASTAEEPQDFFRVALWGLALQPGDRVAFKVNEVRIGDLTRGDGLLLDSRGRARGQMGSAPHIFEDCRLHYQARARRLTLLASRGRAALTGSAAVGETTGEYAAIPVVVLVDRAPGDGVVDTAAVVEVQVRVRVKMQAGGTSLETGRGSGR